MRILYVFRSLAYWGGIERTLVDKMNYLVSKYGHEVYMLTTDQGSHPIPYMLKPEIRIEDLNICFYHQYRYQRLRRYIVAWKKGRLFRKILSERLRMMKPDIIICTTANYVDLNVLVKTKGNIPLVVESHSILQRTLTIGGLKRKYANYMFRKCFQYARVIITLTESDANNWRNIHSCVKVIPDVVHLNNGDLSSLENHRVIWVGRLDYQKRPVEMIKIWKSIHPQHPDWHLDIFGEGEQKRLIEEIAASLGMNIHIHQPTSLIFEHYRNSSMMVLTSLFEPFGLVIPEAMSCGLPVVAYDCPYGPASLISNGSNGFLIKMDDRKMMTEKLCLLMDDVSLRRKMGKVAMESSYRYSPKLIMPMWNDLFNSLSSKID